jgi:NADPH:quinone reductase-like Zn-dependent oxidoreductase
MSEMMRAWAISAYGDPPTLMKVPVPHLKPGDVLIRMHGAEVGDWDDLIRTGGWPMHRPFPLMLGLGGAGRVAAHGPEVRHFRQHDPVYTYSYPLYGNGAWADYMLVPEPYVARAPASLPLPNAGAVPIVGLTAHETIFDLLAPKRGEVVLITAAAGGVGHLAVQMAKHLHAHVIAVCGTDHVEFVRSLGADEVVDYRTVDPVKAILQTHPHGVAKALNGVPGESANTYVKAMAAGGLLIDLPGEITASRPGVKVKGDYVVQGDGGRLAKLARQIDDFLRVTISATFPFERAPDALATVLGKHVMGKVALHIVEPHAHKEESS